MMAPLYCIVFNQWWIGAVTIVKEHNTFGSFNITEKRPSQTVKSVKRSKTINGTNW